MSKDMDKNVVIYKARDNQEVQLTVDIVKNFLVTGRKELVTTQELMYFIAICRARGLNPFTKDAYLIKYAEGDPAAIVTSIDFYRARARAQKDCNGWQKGVICLHKTTGELRYSKGLVLANEEVVGGWFKAQPAGWVVPFELEINLSGYIKTTKTGEPTRFWRKENQPTMLSKCAESQGLRTLWPDEFRGTITGEEAGLQLDNFDALDITDLQGGGSLAEKEPPKVIDTSVFDALLKEKGLSAERLARVQTFIEDTARSQKKTKVTPDEMKVRCGAAPDKFWDVFERWEADPKRPWFKTPEPDKNPEAGAEGVAEPPTDAPRGPSTWDEPPGSLPPFETAPPEAGVLDLAEVNRVWRIVAEKGIPLTELKDKTGVGARDEIAVANLPQVRAYAEAYAPPKKGKK